MRGLIYKDISIFFKSIDKKLILIAAAAIVLLIFNAGIYAGLFASVMFAMTTNHVLHCEYTSTGENLPFLEEEYEVATENGGFQMNGR